VEAGPKEAPISDIINRLDLSRADMQIYSTARPYLAGYLARGGVECRNLHINNEAGDKQARLRLFAACRRAGCCNTTLNALLFNPEISVTV